MMGWQDEIISVEECRARTKGKRSGPDHTVNPTMGHGGEKQAPKVHNQVDIEHRLLDTVEQATMSTASYTIDGAVERLKAFRSEAIERGVVMTVSGVLHVTYHEPGGLVASRHGFTVEVER